MVSIQQIVRESLRAGYLSIESENQLRLLLQTTKYSLEEVRAYAKLQKAAMSGEVRQESRERINDARELKSQLGIAVLL